MATNKEETKMSDLISVERIENRIYLIRGQKVMLDRDLAVLYGVRTKALNQAVMRNLERFPKDFMFQLRWEEVRHLRSQFVTLENDEELIDNQKKSRQGKHQKYLPYVFTENGVAMLSSVLRSKQAIMINIQIMRTFTKLRRILSTHKNLAQKFKELENKLGMHDIEIQGILNALRQLMAPEEKPKRKIGFDTGN